MNDIDSPPPPDRADIIEKLNALLCKANFIPITEHRRVFDYEIKTQPGKVKEVFGSALNQGKILDWSSSINELFGTNISFLKDDSEYYLYATKDDLHTLKAEGVNFPELHHHDEMTAHAMVHRKIEITKPTTGNYHAHQNGRGQNERKEWQH